MAKKNRSNSAAGPNAGDTNPKPAAAPPTLGDDLRGWLATQPVSQAPQQKGEHGEFVVPAFAPVDDDPDHDSEGGSTSPLAKLFPAAPVQAHGGTVFLADVGHPFDDCGVREPHPPHLFVLGLADMDPRDEKFNLGTLITALRPCAGRSVLKPGMDGVPRKVIDAGPVDLYAHVELLRQSDVLGYVWPCQDGSFALSRAFEAEGTTVTPIANPDRESLVRVHDGDAVTALRQMLIASGQLDPLARQTKALSMLNKTVFAASEGATTAFARVAYMFIDVTFPHVAPASDYRAIINAAKTSGLHFDAEALRRFARPRK